MLASGIGMRHRITNLRNIQLDMFIQGRESIAQNGYMFEVWFEFHAYIFMRV